MNSPQISHLSFHDHTGAGRAATRLCGSLREIGLDSRLHVHEKWTAAEWITRPGNIGYELRARLIGRLDRGLTRRAATAGPCAEVFSHNRYSLWRHRWGELADCDIVHLHWVGWSFIALAELGRIRQPVVWTLHDSWPFTGGCHVPGECTRYQDKCGLCPQLHSPQKDDLSAQVWREKSGQYARMDLTVVAPSRWMAERARASALFTDCSVTVIPNAVDTQVFQPMERAAARAQLDLPREVRLVLFGAMGSLAGYNKGADLLAAALERLVARATHEEIVLVLFGGDGTLPRERFPVRTLSLGTINDDTQLRALYSAADVTVVPSRSESFSNIALESMSCGTVCAGFAVGGLPDMIEHGANGFLARPQQPESLAKGLHWALEGGERVGGRSAAARRAVTERFSREHVARQYLALYEERLSRVAHQEAAR